MADRVGRGSCRRRTATSTAHPPEKSFPGDVDPAGRHPSFLVKDGHSGPDQRRGHDMKVMVMVKATADSEAGAMPGTELLEAMGRFNEELVNAGVMLAGEGLHPSS